MPNTPADAPRFDYIVVGAGTAGCLLANRLSADPSKRVLLIEAGGHDDYHWIHIPVGYLYCIGNPRTDWLYSTEPDPGLNGRSLRYPRGKVLGGCSSINGMIYMRGQARDYDALGRDARRRRAGAGTSACRTSCSTKTTSAAPTRCTPRRFDRSGSAPAANGASRSSACAGTSSTRSRRPRSRPASRTATTSTAATTKASATSRSTRSGGCALERGQGLPAPACDGAATCRCGPARRSRRLLIETRPTAAARCTGVEVCATARRARRGAGRARGDPVRRRGRHAAAAAALGHRPGGAAAAARHRRRASSCPASAPTCRTTCRSARCSRSRACATLNTLASSLVRQGADRPASTLLQAQRADEHGAVAARRLHAQRRPSTHWPNLEYHVQPLSLDAFGEPLHRFHAFTASVCNLNPTSRGAVRIRIAAPRGRASDPRRTT